MTVWCVCVEGGGGVIILSCDVHNTEPIKLNGMGPFPVHRYHRTTLYDKRSSCMCLNYL